jgi:hypothetical protein
MPALGNKGKVFCSFVEYHWDSALAWDPWDAKSAGLSHVYSKENKILTSILSSAEVGSPGGSRLAFSTKRQGRYRPLEARNRHTDWRRHINQ